MTILVTGSRGTIGSRVVQNLIGKGADIQALVRDMGEANFPSGVTPVQGDMTDAQSMRAALTGVSTLFLLNAGVADELTQASVTLDLAREAGIRRIVYLSVFNSGLFADVPHFACKSIIERVIDEQSVPATILRPSYFMQNDAGMKDAILGGGIYPSPLGSMGVAMADIRDIAETAAIELLRRERASGPLPRTTIEIVSPEILTGASAAELWAEALGRKVVYSGNDLNPFEKQAGSRMPGWQARDLRMMFRAFHSFGMIPRADTEATLETLLGHPVRSYRDFVKETVKAWLEG